MGKKIIKLLRKIKAYYILILIVLGVGTGGYFLYTKVIKPQMNMVAQAQGEWMKSYTAMEDENKKISTIEEDYINNSAMLIDNYLNFKTIQSKQPNVFDMKTFFSGQERLGLTFIWSELTSPSLINRLNRWTRGYRHLTNRPVYEFAGILGYEDTLTNIQLISVDFGVQEYKAYGYGALLNMVRTSYGYGNTPLIISAPAEGSGGTPAQGGAPATGGAPAGAPPTSSAPPPTAAPPTGSAPPPTGGAPGGAPAASAPAAAAGTEFIITVNTDDPKHRPNRPSLSMNVNAKGAFFTKGWDPNGDIKATIEEAKEWVTDPPKVAALRPPQRAFPKIFFFFGDNEVASQLSN